jgi:hypothetical protein
LWNQQVQTDKTIRNDKPDITIRDNEKATFLLIEVAISGDRNVLKKKAENTPKCKDLLRPYNTNRVHVECKNKCDTCND